jgi:hypothetical protein
MGRSSDFNLAQKKPDHKNQALIELKDVYLSIDIFSLI